MNKDQTLEQLNKRIEEQSKTIDSLNATIGALNDTIKSLQDTIRELRRQIDQDSHNSSKPPSSDGFKKPRTKSLRTPSGKKQGGQKGHKGSHMTIPHAPDHFKQHYPEKCQTCKHLTECISKGNIMTCGEKRYVVDAVMTTTVTEHQAIEVTACPCGEDAMKGNFPDNVKAYVQYGDSVISLAALLSTYGAVSTMRIHTIVGSILGISLSTGTINSMVSKCAGTLAGTLENIKTNLTGAEVGNFDETGADINGKTKWVHSSSSPLYTYQTIEDKRGQEGMEGNGVLTGFTGICVHDCWSPYWKYEGVTHAICNAHLLRELTGIEEFEPEHTWVHEFKALLRSMKKARDRAVAKGKVELSYYYLHKFDLEYDRIMALADIECPEPPDPPKKKKGRKKKGKERSLIERLLALKDAVCLFIHNFKVPFDNNQAERDVRNVKTKMKVSGCFRTMSGAQSYLDVMSFISTGRKHNVNPYEALVAALSGNPDIIFA